VRILITGANGFIGSHLATWLVKQGHEVICFVRKSSDRTRLQGLPVRYHYGDVTERESLRSAVRQIDIIFHAAAVTRAITLAEFERINAQGTENLVVTCLEENPHLQRFVYISSQAAAGGSSSAVPVTETDDPKPISHYGYSKWQGEQVVHHYLNQLPVTIVRPPAVYGPYDPEMLKYARVVKRGLMPLMGLTEKFFSVCFIDDLLVGLWDAATKEVARGQTYFLCHPDGLSWQQFARLVREELHKSIVIPVILPIPLMKLMAIGSEFLTQQTGKPFPLRPQKVTEMSYKYWICSPAKAIYELGFQPSDRDETLRETIRWYIDHQLL